MIRKLVFSLIILGLMVQSGCKAEKAAVKGASDYEVPGVRMMDKGNYYYTVLDFTKGLTHRQIGTAYAQGILKLVPDYPALIDSYLSELIFSKTFYEEMLFRAEDLMPMMNPDYREEIEGMASVICKNTPSIRGDHRLSRIEFYIYNFFPDIFRATQCNFIAVYGSRSSTHQTLLSRNLDWYGGAENELPKIQTFFRLQEPNKTVYMIGFLGYVGLLTGFNNDHVFAAVLDSGTGGSYTTEGKRSYAMDLRCALETQSSLIGVADYMKDWQKHYTFNHLIALADPKSAAVLENNISGLRTTKNRIQRALRYSNSRLNKGISWRFTDAIAAVNSFLLYGNADNHTNWQTNYKRWDSLQKQFQARDKQLTVNDLKSIATFFHGSGPGTMDESGDLYNRGNEHIAIFEPATLYLEVAFHPRNRFLPPADPLFEKIPINE